MLKEVDIYSTWAMVIITIGTEEVSPYWLVTEITVEQH